MHHNNLSARLAAPLAAVLALAAAPGWTQAAPAGQTPQERRIGPATATRLPAGTAIRLDGRLDDPAWAGVPAITEFLEFRPRDGVPAKFPTEARIAYDRDAIYIGFTVRDPDPARIDAPLSRRDKGSGSQDAMTVYLDPVGTRKFAQYFSVNAAGSISDGLLSEDSGNEDNSPDFEFEARAVITPEGWTAEMRIPFSVLRYSDPASENWSILIVRGMVRDQQYRFVNARIPRDQNCLLCYAQTLTGMRDLPPGRELTVTPQLTLRRTTERGSDHGVAGPRREKNDFIAGVDVKYRPRSDLVFDATINPDFSQVELDTPQLSANAQFALFFPEKRPFFLEGADILATPLNAIYTRTITDPAWGARVTRRIDGSDYTFLTVRDDGKGFILLPGPVSTGFARQDTKSQATVGRARWQAQDVTVGVLFTDRTYESAAGIPAGHNRVAGADFVWRPTGELRVRGQALATDTDDPRNPRPPGTPDTGTAAYLDYNFRDPHWNLSGGIEYSSRGMRMDNGFYNQAGFSNIYQNIQRKWTEVGPFIEVSPYLNTQRVTDYAGRMLWQSSNPGVYFLAAKNTQVSLELRPSYLVRYRTDGPTLRRDQFVVLFDTTPGTWLSTFHFETSIGDQGDIANNRMRRGYYIGANASIRLFGRFELEPRIDESVVGNSIVARGADQVLHERAIQLSSVYHFTARDNVRLVAQHNSVRRGREYYDFPVSAHEKTETLSLVYGHLRGLGTNLYVGATTSRSTDPGAAASRRFNEVFLKASWAFDLAALIR